MELAKKRHRDAGPDRIQRIERAGSKRARMRGLTIIEVPIALTMLGFGLLAMAPLFTGAVRTNASSHQLTNANTLAREKMEELIGFPSTDPRLFVGYTKNAAGPDLNSTGTGSIVGTNDFCKNDLPLWYKPSSGETSKASTSPGIGWFSFPYTRTYTVEQFREDLTTRVVTPSDTCATAWDTDTCPGTFGVKLLTVVVRPTSGPFPGLRQTTQSVYVRFRDARPN
jgi:type II secretory pathway pseudopilin PulG